MLFQRKTHVCYTSICCNSPLFKVWVCDYLGEAEPAMSEIRCVVFKSEQEFNRFFGSHVPQEPFIFLSTNITEYRKVLAK